MHLTPESKLPLYRFADDPKEEKSSGVMDDRIRTPKDLDNLGDGSKITR